MEIFRIHRSSGWSTPRCLRFSLRFARLFQMSLLICVWNPPALHFRGATRLRGSALNPRSSVSALSPKLRLWNQDFQGDLEKTSNFILVSKADKVRKTTPEASKKHTKTTLEHQKNDFCENLFLQYLPFKNHCKKWPGNKLQQKHRHFSLLNPKNFQNVVPKLLKIWFLASMGPSFSSNGSLGGPQADKMVPRVVKWRHQTCQMIGFGHPM